jgi:hypothetical protein
LFGEPGNFTFYDEFVKSRRWIDARRLYRVLHNVCAVTWGDRYRAWGYFGRRAFIFRHRDWLRATSSAIRAIGRVLVGIGHNRIVQWNA